MSQRNSQQGKNSRKKLAAQSTHSSHFLPMRSPNLKLDFFTSEPGLPLQIFRKSEIASIREHLLSFISSTKHAETKNRYKKIVLVVGSSGTGKSSSIKMVLDEINGFLLGNLKEFGDLEMLRVIYMNANSSYNCQSIVKEIQEIDGLEDNELPRLRVQKYTYAKIPKTSKRECIDVVYIQQIDRLVDKNNGDVLQNFMMYLSGESNQFSKNLVGDTADGMRYRRMLIGTSNDINVQYTLLGKVQMSETEVQTIIFQVYGSEAIVSILKDKIDLVREKLGIELVISDTLIRYLVNKLQQNKKDDVRSVIQVAKQLLLCSGSYSSDSVDEKSKKVQITMQTINSCQKIKSMISNSKVALIEKLPIKQHLVLITLYRFFRKNEELEMPYMRIVQQYRKMQNGMNIVTYDDITQIIKQLQTYNCISLRMIKSQHQYHKTNKSIKNGTNNYNDKSIKSNMKDIESALSKVTWFKKYFYEQ